MWPCRLLHCAWDPTANGIAPVDSCCMCVAADAVHTGSLSGGAGDRACLAPIDAAFSIDGAIATAAAVGCRAVVLCVAVAWCWWVEGGLWSFTLINLLLFTW